VDHGSSELPAFPDFEQGYANTESVQSTTGVVNTDAGAGQLNYAVPVTLVAQTRDGSTQTSVGCYRLHLAQAAIQAEPPFQPMAIRSATVEQVDNDADTETLMKEACQP
jgi:hypothetical protein